MLQKLINVGYIEKLILFIIESFKYSITLYFGCITTNIRLLG